MGTKFHKLGITYFQLGSLGESRSSFQESKRNLQRASLIFSQLGLLDNAKAIQRAIDSLEITERSCFNLSLNRF